MHDFSNRHRTRQRTRRRQRRRLQSATTTTRLKRVRCVCARAATRFRRPAAARLRSASRRSGRTKCAVRPSPFARTSVAQSRDTHARTRARTRRHAALGVFRSRGCLWVFVGLYQTGSFMAIDFGLVDFSVSKSHFQIFMLLCFV